MQKRLTFIFCAALLILCLFPPLWIDAELPSGATTNTVTAFLGHLPIYSDPLQYEAFGAVVNAEICLPQVIVEVLMLSALYLVLIYAIRIKVQIKKMSRWQKGLQWVFLTVTLALCLCPPWWAFEGQPLYFEKYGNFEFWGHLPVLIVPAQVEIGSWTAKPQICYLLLGFELYWLVIIAFALFCFFRPRDKQLIAAKG